MDDVTAQIDYKLLSSSAQCCMYRNACISIYMYFSQLYVSADYRKITCAKTVHVAFLDEQKSRYCFLNAADLLQVDRR